MCIRHNTTQANAIVMHEQIVITGNYCCDDFPVYNDQDCCLTCVIDNV